MRGHYMIPEGDVEACVNCGREPWMASYGEECLGPHPDFVKIRRNVALGRLTWEDIALNVFVVVFSASVWALVGLVGWQAFKGLRSLIGALL